MRKRDLILAMCRHEKVRAFDPRSKTYGEPCIVKRVSYIHLERSRVAISAELWGHNSVYHELSKHIRLAREVATNEA